MKHQTIACSFTIFILATTAEAAEIVIKPGLWEISTSSQLIGLASQLPPDQMRGLQDLAKEYGFEVPEIKDGKATSTTCLSPEMAKQNIVPSTFDNDAGCTVSNIKRAGNSYQMEYMCKNPQIEGSGIAQGTLTSAEQFSGQTTFNGILHGSPFKEQANIQGKWLGSNCETKAR